MDWEELITFPLEISWRTISVWYHEGYGTKNFCFYFMLTTLAKITKSMSTECKMPSPVFHIFSLTGFLKKNGRKVTVFTIIRPVYSFLFEKCYFINHARRRMNMFYGKKKKVIFVFVQSKLSWWPNWHRFSHEKKFSLISSFLYLFLWSYFYRLFYFSSKRARGGYFRWLLYIYYFLHAFCIYLEFHHFHVYVVNVRRCFFWLRVDDSCVVSLGSPSTKNARRADATF